MAYVDENLLPGEVVVYRARLHRLIYAIPAAIALLGAIAIVIALLNKNWVELALVGGLILLVAGLIAFVKWTQAATSEFAVTNRRVVIKVGLIQRRTVELLLQKVEGIGVDQTLFGRLLDFGSISVTGTGGTKEFFANIADPLEFRRQVQAQTANDAHSSYAPIPNVANLSTAGGPFCVACGTQNPPNAQFCMRCGQRLAVAT